MTATLTALPFPPAPRWLLALAACAAAAWFCGLLLALVDLTGPQWRG